MVETAFTPLLSLAGGALIGTAAVLLMAAMGRIMGATGILAGLIRPANLSDWSWRACVIAGMISGPLLFAQVTGGMPDLQIPVSTTMLLIGGFLVGLGVTFGAGCTSGHGVCGLARGAPRSIVATVVFMLTTTLTVYVTRHVMGS